MRGSRATPHCCCGRTVGSDVCGNRCGRQQCPVVTLIGRAQQGRQTDAVREPVDTTLPFVIENVATLEYDEIYEI
jgi:hypothetical protein